MVFKRGGKNKEVVGSELTHAEPEKKERISNKLEHVMVVENKIDQKQNFKSKLKKITSHRRFKPAVIAFAVVVVAATLLAFFARKEEPIADTGPKCTYQMLEKAKPNLAPKKVTKLEPQARALEQLPGYDQDVNCLYVTLIFYINISDAEHARRDYDKLAAVYDPGQGFANPIADAALPPERLESEVEFLEEQVEANEDQSFLTPPIESFGGGDSQ